MAFEYEVYEYKFREVTSVYWTLVNCLIEGFENLSYERKEVFLESLPKIEEVLKEVKWSLDCLKTVSRVSLSVSRALQEPHAEPQACLKRPTRKTSVF